MNLIKYKRTKFFVGYKFLNAYYGKHFYGDYTGKYEILVVLPLSGHLRLFFNKNKPSFKNLPLISFLSIILFPLLILYIIAGVPLIMISNHFYESYKDGDFNLTGDIIHEQISTWICFLIYLFGLYSLIRIFI